MIVPARGCRLRLEKDACLDLRGRLVVGRKAVFPASKAETRLLVGRNATLRVLSSSSIYSGSDIRIYDGATLVLDGVILNEGTDVTCRKEIVIGRGSLIGRHVALRDTDGHRLLGDHDPEAAISIGEHVWIGTRAMILKGVTIGDGAVVAAGSVVSRDVPPASMVAGVPARVIRENVVWDPPCPGTAT